MDDLIQSIVNYFSVENVLKLGYNTQKIERIQYFNDKIKLETFDVSKAENVAVGIKIGSMSNLPHELDDLVTATIVIHTVDVETGRYIQSRERSVAVPMRTRSVSLTDVTSPPCWNEELVIDAQFIDVVNINTLLLFEVYNRKPSLSTSRNRKQKPSPKLVAWGYLFPVGYTGNLYCSIPKDWNTSSDLRSEAPSTNIDSARANVDNDADDKRSKPRRKSWKDKKASTEEKITDSPLTTEAAASLDFDKIYNQDDKISTTDAIDAERKLDQKHLNHKPNSSTMLDDNWIHVQLYKPCMYDGILGSIQRRIMKWPSLHPEHNLLKNSSQDIATIMMKSYPSGIPPVYLQWRRRRLIPMQNSWVRISMRPRPLPAKTSMSTSANMPIDTTVQPSSQVEDQTNMNERESKSRAALLKRLRAPNEPCAVPDRVLHRLDVGPQGALVIKYSHSGHLLAVAAKSPRVPVYMYNPSSSMIAPIDPYALRFFDTDKGVEVWSCGVAHYGPIYELSWSKDDSYIISCSGDGTIKVWDVLPLLSTYIPLMGDAYVNNPRIIQTYFNDVPSPVYSAIFQEYASSPITATIPTSPRRSLSPKKGQRQRSPTRNSVAMGVYYDRSSNVRLPPHPVISGSMDGRIRIWHHNRFIGFVSVSSSTYTPVSSISSAVDHIETTDPAHRSRVQALVINERTKYLLSGDSLGEVYVWRLDNNGWYQLLRKLRRDVSQTTNNLIDSADNQCFYASGVMTMTMHPDKPTNQLLLFQHQPSVLRMYGLTNYKVLSTCAGFVSSLETTRRTIYQKACLSADGKYIVCGATTRSTECSTGINSHLTGDYQSDGDRVYYHLNIWDSQTGTKINSKISEYLYPYPVRSVCWHPRQHTLAVALMGERAAVIIYVGVKEETETLTMKMNSSIISGFYSDQEKQFNNENGNVNEGLELESASLLSRSTNANHPDVTNKTDSSADRSNRVRDHRSNQRKEVVEGHGRQDTVPLRRHSSWILFVCIIAIVFVQRLVSK